MIRNRQYIIPCILFFFFFFLLAKISATEQNTGIGYLNVEEGLSQNEVTSIIQDKNGFMWFGTRGGLNRYDGYQFKHFKPRRGEQNSILNPSIERIFSDRSGNIWIGAKTGGLCMYDPISESIKHFPDSLELANKRIISLGEDSKGQIWFGTWKSGAYRLNPQTMELTHFMGDRNVFSINESRDSVIWLGSSTGLTYIEKDEKEIHIDRGVTGRGQYTQIIEDPDEPFFWVVGWETGLKKFNYRSKELVYDSQKVKVKAGTLKLPARSYCVLDDQDNHLWIGTWGNGLFRFNKRTLELQMVPLAPPSLSATNKDYDVILDLMQDNKGNIWIGLDGGGVARIQSRQPFKVIGYNPVAGAGLSNAHITCVLEDRNNTLWIGTKGGGLFRTNDRKHIKPVSFPQLSESEFEKQVIKTLYETTDGKILVGINTGLGVIDYKSSRPSFTMIKRGLLDFRKITAILQDKDNYWIGTQQNGLFLLAKDQRGEWIFKQRWDAVPGVFGQLQNERISCLHKDSKSRIWIGTYEGLHLFDNSDSTFTLIDNRISEGEKLICNIILNLHQDHTGNFWVGTPCGLNKLEETAPLEFTLSSYTVEDGLPDDYIHGVLEDEEKNIWISTNSGLTRFDVEQNIFRNFDQTDGIQGLTFSEGATFKSSSGELFFGGVHGLTYFNPSQITENPNIPEIVITDLTVLNNPIVVGKPYKGKVILDRSLNELEELVLSYNEKEFSIEFAALDYTAPDRNQYAYWLEGSDEEWKYIGNRHYVSFNNLKAGSYILHLKGSNNNNIWNEVGKQLRIKVLPPPWKTWYALVLYIMFALGLVTIVRWNAVKQERLSKNLEMEKIKGDQDRQINEMKLRFFTNVSHEFRTPLTLIIAPIREILSHGGDYQLSEDLGRKMSVINNNAQRLLRLVNQLIDFRKSESGEMKLKASPNDFSQFVYEVGLPFKELAEINHINFKIVDKLKNKEVWFDRDKLEMVINNLLSNAFKFVPTNGHVILSLSEDKEWIFMKVEDNGKGIPEGETEKIFERFYQVESQKNYGSSGIGLALTKRLVLLHKGEISVESVPNERTVFSIQLPKGVEHLALDQRDLTTEEKSSPTLLTTSQIPVSAETKVTKRKSEDAKAVLVVEDNAEVRNYLADLLTPYYHVLTANDGREGLDMTVQHIPDLIISDVMMPNMDGFELCEKVKSEEQTSHIPIILLTAKTADQFRLLGVKTGADAYVSKPFNPEYLLEKIRQILIAREKWEKKYSKKIKLGPKEVEITPADEKIINKAIQIIEKYLDSPEFDAGKFASEMGMSLSTLNRKLKPITGQAPAKFIRTIRMKRAAQLLADPEKTVSEIALETGFMDLKNFRTSFINEFGVKPSEYRKRL